VVNPPIPAQRHAWDVQRGVLLALLLREMKARVGGQWIGAVWTVFEPLAHVALLVTVLGFLRGMVVPGVEVPVFLVTGLIAFFLFQNLFFRLMDGIEANRGLFNYRQVKPLDPLLSRAAVETIMSMIVTLFSLGILGWMGYHVLPARPLEALLTGALVVAMGMACGIWAAVVSHERPRVKTLLRLLTLPLYFASGVIFPVFVLPREYIEWLLWNPLLHVVELARHAFIGPYLLHEGVNAQYPLMFALIMGALGMALYRANRQRLVTVT
jgi:capsular polysaccharide transport system permease protein